MSKYVNTVKVDINGTVEEFEAGAWEKVRQMSFSSVDLDEDSDWHESDLTGLLSDCVLVDGLWIDRDLIPAIAYGEYLEV